MAAKTKPFDKYLQLLGQWKTGVALPTLWFCTFDLGSVNALKGSLSNQLKNYESSLGSSGWDIKSSTVSKLTQSSLQYDSDNLMGCVFAKQVSIPSEQVTARHDGLSYGGFTSPITSDTRQQPSNFNVTFLETNASFIDFVLKPWCILVGYNGMVARSTNSKKSIKCSQCDMCMLAKAGAGQELVIRKIYRYYNVAPITVNGESYSHETDGLKTTQVTFAYDGYTILSP